MGILRFNGVGVTGVAACVPKSIVRNVDIQGVMTEKEIHNTIKTTGIAERRFAAPDVCASDLCFEAAGRLLGDMAVDPASVDLVIFVSQTPDYRQPCTATGLQHRLGMPKSAGAFDVNLACSGYVYGLSTAFAYASQEGVERVLLLAGETMSKTISMKDRATCMLFGDGGAATLIEKAHGDSPAWFSLNSDGAGAGVLQIPAGGYRTPSSEETVKLREQEEGSLRSDEQLFMDGMEVFNFTMREVPLDIKAVLEASGCSLEEVDYVLYHQANKRITDFFAKKLKHPAEKAPYCLDRFGNTSSVSIPLTMVSELKDRLSGGRNRVILCGYGAGLSWATALLDLDGCTVSNLVEI